MHLSISKASAERMFSPAPRDTRSKGHKLNHKFLNIRLHIEDNRTLEQAAQEGNGVSLPGDIQNPAVQVPLSPAIGDSTLAGGLNQTIPTGPFQP